MASQKETHKVLVKDEVLTSSEARNKVLARSEVLTSSEARNKVLARSEVLIILYVKFHDVKAKLKCHSPVGKVGKMGLGLLNKIKGLDHCS